MLKGEHLVTTPVSTAATAPTAAVPLLAPPSSRARRALTAVAAVPEQTPPDSGQAFPERVVGPPPLTLVPTPPPVPALTSRITLLLADIGARVGEPLSLTITSATAHAHVHAPDGQAFRAWCRELGTDVAVRHPQTLYPAFGVHSAAVVEGWTIHVHLYGEPTETM